jgi:hypothetical protein
MAETAPENVTSSILNPPAELDAPVPVIRNVVGDVNVSVIEVLVWCQSAATGEAAARVRVKVAKSDP